MCMQHRALLRNKNTLTHSKAGETAYPCTHVHNLAAVIFSSGVVFVFFRARFQNDKLPCSCVYMLLYNDRSMSKQHSKDRLCGEATIIRMHTRTHTTQLQGPQGHFSSDRSHCKEAAARTSCQSPPTHIIVSQHKSFTLHMLTGRHLGLEEKKTKCKLHNYNLCKNMFI